MQKIGIVGVGNFGKFHVEELLKIPEFELVGFYDINPHSSELVSKKFNIKAFNSFAELLNEVEVIDVAVPTSLHYVIAVEAIKKQKHVFIEKPVTITVEDAENLVKLAEEASIKVQVGHIERFNSAFLAALPYINNPYYIEIQRLQKFINHNTDTSVVLNLMLHDIDIVLSVNNSNIKKINAFGIKNINQTSDFANARIEFDNGCVANITSNRVSPIELITYNFFQKNVCISIDLLNKRTEIINYNPIAIGSKSNQQPINTKFIKDLSIKDCKIIDEHSLKKEFLAFYNCIANNSKPSVTLNDGFKALKVANEIIDKIKVSADF